MAVVLLVEDESLIRMMVVDMLGELGHSVAGEAGDLASGLRLAAELDFDLAILDVKLGHKSSEDIALTLRDRGIPFTFASGYGMEGVPNAFKNYPALRKPFTIDELDCCLTALLS